MKKWLVIFCILFAFPKEAQVSQVFIEEQDAIPLKEYINERMTDTEHILIVKPSGKSELFMKHVFPKSSHYLKEEETTYQEYVAQYEIIEIIRSEKFKAADHFWVWTELNYGYEAIQAYHEQGLLESPIVFENKTNYPIEADDLFVVFINKIDKTSSSFPEVYTVNIREGKGAVKEIKKLLKKRK